MIDINKERVDVISCVFNPSINFEKSVISVLNQTYSFFRFIVVDDGSNDKDSALILRKSNHWIQRFRLFTTKK